MFGFSPRQALLQRLGLLRREQGPPQMSAIAEMVEDLLTDQLAFTIAIGRQDDVVAVL